MLKMTTDYHQTYHQQFLDKSSARNEILPFWKCYAIASGGFRVGGARGKTKKGVLWWRHHIQPTVIITFDLPKIWPPKDMFLRLQHNWNSRRRKCKTVFTIHNFENSESHWWSLETWSRSRDPFFRVSVSEVSGLGLCLEGFRSRALRHETLHRLFFWSFARSSLKKWF